MKNKFKKLNEKELSKVNGGKSRFSFLLGSISFYRPRKRRR
ncbi:bacteriocin [Pediococcus claussenii]|uniref:Bacteriocin-type signal sequence domain protein n=1 Tax=Pediococcus claussenii (strain ATCC BAA-344 / DSM 14800 / JCM 18046 / KCTC 3811 / LMG 21948 / P06) TaxID=701521 RepID=G8PB41_PEDCP|nr:bacteriocin [Pediococcus claussenii]AEV94670.1 bacteriocin-type signal sequence domain protein [Pediococcus claussenii ATCC BAA-344]